MEPSATICAIATAPAAGGIGVLRISGPLATAASLPLAPRVPSTPEARRAYFTELTDRRGAVLDEGLFLFFAAPNSYTGEDVVELQTHGGPRLLSLLLHEVLADGRVRLAEAGEFSRQAFLNGRMDLTRAEAVAALVSAESEAAVRAAASQLSGSLADRVLEVRSPLVDLRADLEGALAFPDEAEGAEAGARERLSSLSGALAALLADARRGALVRRTARAVLYGPVNAGKSTLFNRLAGEERALVDPEPGTTRDLVEARLELCGYGLALVDTAGLRPAPGRVEALGIEKARRALASADLAVLLAPPEATQAEVEGWRREAGEVPVLVVCSKADLARAAPADPRGLAVSGATGSGVEELRGELARRLCGGAGAASFAASEWMVDALQRAAGSLDRAERAAELSTLEVVAGELGLAAEALGQITGETAPEELLDAIFRRFCVGK